MTIDSIEVAKAYAYGAWGDLPIFCGDLINFGYWKYLLDKNSDELITKEKKIKSSYALYKYILDKIKFSENEILLEIGCGRGAGAMYTCRNYFFNRLFCVDMSADQIDCAKNKFEKFTFSEKVQFIKQDITDPCFFIDNIDFAFSVEAFQHIADTEKAFRRIKQALKPNGKIAIATYFAKKVVENSIIESIFPLVLSKQESIKSITLVQDELEKAGFLNIEIEAIGDYVFYGYEKWVRQQNAHPCSFAYFKAYEEGILDYYVITATI